MKTNGPQKKKKKKKKNLGRLMGKAMPCRHN